MIYLDHAASAPLHPAARDAWLAATELVGNASSVHGAGQQARRLLEQSREQIAASLGCEPIEVVLTSGGTESINLAIKGLWWSRTLPGPIVLPDGEHHATLDAVTWLETHQGAQVRAVPLNEVGFIEPERFAEALPGAALATALVANSEVGTLQDPTALSAAAAAAGVPLHLDAVAALGHIDVNAHEWRGDARGSDGLVALSVSGHKIGAPVGTGALFVSRHAELTPLLHGGGQQRSLRSGTQDVAGAAALAAALEATLGEREAEGARLRALAERLWAGISDAVPGAEMLGDPVRRLPGNVHVLLPGAAGESMLFLLDQRGISVSTGAACQAGVAEASHVVQALGRSESEARSVLRFTLGRDNTDEHVDTVIRSVAEAYASAHRAGTVSRS